MGRKLVQNAKFVTRSTNSYRVKEGAYYLKNCKFDNGD